MAEKPDKFESRRFQFSLGAFLLATALGGIMVGLLAKGCTAYFAHPMPIPKDEP
jgi:hypothetical protein